MACQPSETRQVSTISELIGVHLRSSAAVSPIFISGGDCAPAVKFRKSRGRMSEVFFPDMHAARRSPAIVGCGRSDTRQRTCATCKSRTPAKFCLRLHLCFIYTVGMPSRGSQPLFIGPCAARISRLTTGDMAPDGIFQLARNRPVGKFSLTSSSFLAFFFLVAGAGVAAPPFPGADAFIQKNCVGCHNSSAPAAKLDLAKLDLRTR